MLDQSVITPSKSPWGSPVVLVNKRDGTTRFCVDYHRLNAVTKTEVLPLPRVDDSIDQLTNSRFFTILDLAAGYWQVLVDVRKQRLLRTLDCSNFLLYPLTSTTLQPLSRGL